jgi:hypothetical protein
VLADSLPQVAGEAVHYLGWLNEQQVGLGLMLLAAGLVFGRLPRQYRVLLGGSIAIVWAFFATYPYDEPWSLGRYLLPIVPAVAIVEASVLVRLVEVGPFRMARIAALLAASLVFVLASHHWAGDHAVFQIGDAERKYATTAEWVRQYVQGPAVILAMQHSGSLRMYGDLATARYDGNPDKLLPKLTSVQAAGGSVYLLVEDWEIQEIQSREPILLQGASQVAYLGQGDVTLFRLAPLSGQ